MENYAIKQMARERLKGRWGKAALATLLYTVVIGGIVGIVTTVAMLVTGVNFAATYPPSTLSGSRAVDSSMLWAQSIGSVVSILISGPFVFGYIVYCMHVSRGEEATYNNVFEGFNQIKRTLVTYLLTQLYTLLWTLLLIVPGIIKAYSYAMTFYILADNPDIRPSEAIKESMRIMNGHKMRLFMLHLSFLGWTLLAVLTCGVLSLWIQPYMEVASIHFYEGIKSREPAGAIEEAPFGAQGE